MDWDIYLNASSSLLGAPCYSVKEKEAGMKTKRNWSDRKSQKKKKPQTIS